MTEPLGTSLAETTHPPVTDIVLEGGGVKGIGLVGALQPIAEHGYSFARIAGTSAGAMVAAVLAAMQQRAEPVSRLDDIARSLDYRKFRDRGGIAGHWPLNSGPLGLIADGLSVIFERGAYEGDYLRDWVAGVLGEFGVKKFGDLLLDDPGSDGTLHHRYRLVVIASDVFRKRLAHLPWDYGEYGLDPDEQEVALAGAGVGVDAVLLRARRPHGRARHLDSGRRRTAVELPDLGLRPGRQAAAALVDDRRPAVRSDHGGGGGRPAASVQPGVPRGGVGGDCDRGQPGRAPPRPGEHRPQCLRRHRRDRQPGFSLTREQQALLLDRGREAGEPFIAEWDYDAWLRRYRPGWSSGPAGEPAP